MRIRVLKNFSVGDRNYRAGEVVDVASHLIASALITHNFAMQDKSLDGASEATAASDGKTERNARR